MGEIPLDILHVRPMIPPPGLRRDMGIPTGPRLDTQIPRPYLSRNALPTAQEAAEGLAALGRMNMRYSASLSPTSHEPQMPTADNLDPLAWQKYELALAEWEEAQAIAVVEQRERAKMQAREDARLERRRKFWRQWRWPLVGTGIIPLFIWATTFLMHH